MIPLPRLSRSARFASLVAVALALGACAKPGPGDVSASGVYDPAERTNRSIHAFNKGFDRAIFRPVSKGFTAVVPDPVEDALINFSENLSEPSDTVNFLLQGRFPEAGRSLGRFVINTIWGLGGLFDGATEMGLAPTDTDFGETLYRWGAREGSYVELPFFGPSNQRDAVGVVTDFFTNPLSLTLALPLDNPGFYTGVVQRTIERGRFSDTIDSVLYESADSYSQARLIYLQSRRFKLGDTQSGAFTDPYSDPYDDPYADPYADPYDDPLSSSAPIE
ncbi:MAG: VacJ family lipoprotein [Marinibacterium sp.]|nr:VacJ family lipoprotein [Marinibacterium sp.]